jgi:L-alanine-DL-glutamate epimerase-like enolase superfamily enzyme
MSTISGVDMALWDLKGKALGKPVYELLGGKYRDEVRVYVSALFNMSNKRYTINEALRYMDEGYTALKLGYGGFGFNYKNDITMIKELRDALGYDIDLMVDGPTTLSYSRALKLAKAMEKYDIFWWEEPLVREDLGGYAKLAASTDLRIAAGEGERTYYGFKDLIDKEAADVLQPDLSWVGGLTEAKKIAELAYHTNKEWVPHNWGTVINTAASLHLVAARPDGFICEYGIGPRTMEDAAPEEGLEPSPMIVELPKAPFEVSNGSITIPKEPGLGIELNQQAFEKWRDRH